MADPVEEGVDIDNDDGQTALRVAVIDDDLEMVKLLLSRGADPRRKTRARRVNVDDDEEVTTCECANSSYCLHAADEFGNEMRDDGQNALHLAAKYSSDALLRLLIDRIDNVDAPSDDQSTALHYATQNCRDVDSDERAMEVLLKSGARVNARNREGKTPLYLAVKFEKVHLVAYLLSRGADVNAATARQSTPLYSAVVNCNLELTRLLLANGASTEVRNQRDETPLFYSLRVVPRGEVRVSLVETLLDFGASADCRNSHGSTAVHVAVQDRDESLVRLMSQRGCPIDAKDRFDVSALGMAVCTNRHSEAKLLLELGADAKGYLERSSILEHAIIRRDELMVGLLLQHKADVNASDRAVAAACAHKNTRIMQMLIEHGADINYKDAHGRTPLMKAIREPNYAMVRHLLEHGARIDERDCHGNSVFHVLFDNSSHAKENVIEYLLEQGADPNVENDDGHTPLSYMMFKCFTKAEVHVFIRHIALLHARRRRVNPKISRRIEADRSWTDYANSCRAELTRMRQARILDKCSYFDILTMRRSALRPLFQMENAAQEFELGLRTNALIIYHDVLRRCFNGKFKRSRLLRDAVEVMTNDVFRNIFPMEVIEKLCEYLSNQDLYLIHST